MSLFCLTDSSSTNIFVSKRIATAPKSYSGMFYVEIVGRIIVKYFEFNIQTSSVSSGIEYPHSLHAFIKAMA